ncbi:transcription regulator [Pseudomonas phage AH02]|nr:transcription regulator [Pseudomonas phage AH02]
MTPYIGDRQLEPDDDLEPELVSCAYCDGNGSTNPTWSDPLGDQCPDCLGTGVVICFDMSDPGEPNDYPEE